MPVEIRRDPVCNMEVEPGEAVAKTQFGEWIYCFCSARCKELFDADPLRYLLKK